jgi:hypothetical protein
MLNKQIAFDLGVSEKMIKAHRRRVMDKMGAGSLAELVRLAAALAQSRNSDRSARPGDRRHPDWRSRRPSALARSRQRTGEYVGDST